MKLNKAEIIDKAKTVLFVLVLIVGPVALIIALDDGRGSYSEPYDFIRK
jgi:hypothetical protein